MKNLNLSIVLGLFIILLGITSCGDLDDTETVGLSKDVITKDSELFQLINKVTLEGNNPTEHIVCLDFIYPFKILIYDSNLNKIGSQVLGGDSQFSAFLGSLPANQSISISYPISTTLSDGSVFSVNNNSELKIAIESCSREDIVIYYNSLFGGCNCPEAICVWKIPFTSDGDNKYASGIFESNGDGTLHFHYNGTDYTGTWVFLFVDNKLHMNINLEGTSQVAQDWNMDREIEMINDDIKIKNTPTNIILRKSCQQSVEYEIGATGPAGGIVFYDKGSYNLGWRYMEAAPSDLSFFEWGCLGSLISNSNSSQIGNGLLNSVSIANYHDNLLNYYTNPGVCNPLNNGSVVAKKALVFELNYYKDWFLASESELLFMYQNLQTQSLGSFTNSNYWSSTQIDGNNAITIDFSNGNSVVKSKIPSPNNIKARAIRYF